MSLCLSHTFEVLQVGFKRSCCTNHKGLLLGNQAVKQKPNILSSGGGGGGRRCRRHRRRGDGGGGGRRGDGGGGGGWWFGHSHG